MKFKELIKKSLMPSIDIEGDRFTITPTRYDGGVIDAELSDDKATVPVRRESAPGEQSVPKVGRIPKHSWGS